MSNVVVISFYNIFKAIKCQGDSSLTGLVNISTSVVERGGHGIMIMFLSPLFYWFPKL